MPSNTQLLIHDGEVRQIVNTIKEGNRKVSGRLFGLWRNSLKQPVVQIVTGPERKTNGNSECKEIIRKDHALLQLGSWFNGEASEYDSTEFDNFGKDGQNILLFIKFDGRTVSGKFIMRLTGEEETVGGELYKEDVLPGESSFRLVRTAKNIGEYTRQWEHTKLQNLDWLIDTLSSRDAPKETTKQQWYLSEQGGELLQSINRELQRHYEVAMSRNSETHQLQLTLNNRYFIDFPDNFPEEQALLGKVNSGAEPTPLSLSLIGDDKARIARSLVDEVTSRFPPMY